MITTIRAGETLLGDLTFAAMTSSVERVNRGEHGVEDGMNVALVRMMRVMRRGALMKRLRAIGLAAALLLACGLWGCASGGASSPASSGSGASSGGEAVQESQESQEPQQAESEFIYPWVVSKATHSNASGLVQEYAYEYDDAGRLVSITGLQEEIVGYNERGIRKVALTYDADGRLSSIEPGTYRSGSYSIEYDSDGRAVRVAHEWTEEGRMPNAGANAYVTDYSYGADGELTASQSTYTVEGAVEESVSRAYSATADAGYDGMAESDGAPPLVEWKDGQVMAGNGIGTGSIGKFDAHGNLVSATGGTDGTVTYEYEQIKVKRGEWRPSALSNPTLRTFAWDDLSTVNYKEFFPPQLTAADEARVLGADTIEQEPATGGE